MKRPLLIFLAFLAHFSEQNFLRFPTNTSEHTGQILKESCSVIRASSLSLSFSCLILSCSFRFCSCLCSRSSRSHSGQCIAFALPYLPWLIAVPLVALAAFIWDGVYIGMTLTSRMFLSMLVSAIVFFALWFALGSRYGNHALWFAFMAYLATRSLMQTLLFIYGRISFRS